MTIMNSIALYLSSLLIVWNSHLLLLVVDGQTTPAPSSALDAQLNQLAAAYQIHLVNGTTAIDSSDNFIDGILTYDINISMAEIGELAPITTWDFETCSTTAYPDTVLAVTDERANPIVDGLFGIFGVRIDIINSMLGNFIGSLVTEDDVYNHIAFCARADLGTIMVDNITTSVSMLMMKFNITVDMQKGFSTASIDTVEVAETEITENAQFDYGLSSCPCDASTLQCLGIDQTFSQNSVINICITVNGSDALIVDIKDFYFTKSSIQVNVIDNYVRSSIVTTSDVTQPTNNLIVSTRLVSVLFNDDVSDVLAGGVCMMTFASGRKLGRIRGSAERSVQTTTNEADFSVGFTLDLSTDDSGISNSSSVWYTNMLAVCLLMMGAIELFAI